MLAYNYLKQSIFRSVATTIKTIIVAIIIIIAVTTIVAIIVEAEETNVVAVNQRRNSSVVANRLVLLLDVTRQYRTIVYVLVHPEHSLRTTIVAVVRLENDEDE